MGKRLCTQSLKKSTTCFFKVVYGQKRRRRGTKRNLPKPSFGTCDVKDVSPKAWESRIINKQSKYGGLPLGFGAGQETFEVKSRRGGNEKSQP